MLVADSARRSCKWCGKQQHRQHSTSSAGTKMTPSGTPSDTPSMQPVEQLPDIVKQRNGASQQAQ